MTVESLALARTIVLISEELTPHGRRRAAARLRELADAAERRSDEGFYLRTADALEEYSRRLAAEA